MRALIKSTAAWTKQPCRKVKNAGLSFVQLTPLACTGRNSNSDTTKYELAQKQLEELIRTNKEEDRDFVWAEAHESLADFFWTNQHQVNWGAGWPHYQAALDWWAGQREIKQARERYLKIIFKAAESPRANEPYYYTYYGNYIPLNFLENALKISEKDDEKTRLHFLIAMTMRNYGVIGNRVIVSSTNLKQH